MSITPNLKHFEKLQKCNQLDLDELIDILIDESIFLSESKRENSDEFSDSFAILAMELINNLEQYRKIKSQQEAILTLESEKREIESNRDKYIKSVSQYMRIYQSITQYFFGEGPSVGDKPFFQEITDANLLKEWLIKDQNAIQQIIDDIILSIDFIRRNKHFLFPRSVETDFPLIFNRILNFNQQTCRDFYISNYVLDVLHRQIIKGKYGQFVQLCKNKDIKNEVEKMMHNNMELCKIEKEINKLKKNLYCNIYKIRLDFIYKNIIESMKIW